MKSHTGNSEAELGALFVIVRCYGGEMAVAFHEVWNRKYMLVLREKKDKKG